MKLLDELKWRGLVSHTTDEEKLAALLDGKPINFYCGFDPTAPSLHHGNLVQIILMRHLQLKGHKPYLVIGGATGLIGDPRQSGERVMNEKSTVTQWAENLSKQTKRFFDFESGNKAEIVNNLDWTNGISIIDFLRDIGKYFRVGNMLSKETVSKRLNSEEGISYTEFSYSVMQAWDFLNLFKKYNVILQTGGQDQWGNLTAGLDLIRKKESAEVAVLTTPIITKADGSKFGKSEGGETVWLNPDMMSPYSFYQFWFNSSDEDAINYLKIFTFLPVAEIENIIKQHETAPHERLAQKALAKEITLFVHGESGLDNAIATTQFFFSNRNKDAGGDKLSKSDVEKSISEKSFYQALYSLKNEEPATANIGNNIVDCFVSAHLVQSKSEARRSIKEGGLYLNHERITDENYNIAENDFYYGKYALLKKGKKNSAGLQLKLK
ncbi:MAG: tyrosine--tRNA ligase [Bifidobacteriaceae bacterium]|jgi:tyrosyl-tRNA synthetase|nr:tyrosine--tRNA ligase [Bifidobacteriaceae bacterium]